MKMAGLSHTGRVDSQQALQGRGFSLIGNTGESGATALMCKVSVFALASSILVQPALAQSAAPAQVVAQASPATCRP